MSTAEGLIRLLPLAAVTLLGCAPEGPTVPYGAAPPRVGVRRLSRLQYDRTVQHLLGTRGAPATATWPADDRRHGFDSLAGAPPPSPLYVALVHQTAEALAAEAVGTPDQPGPLLAECAPSDTCAAQVLDRFAPLALRRPVSAAEQAALFRRYADAAGSGFHAALAVPVTELLSAPEMLFRLEANPPGPEAAPLSEPELATRLAFLVWASAPDAALLFAPLHDPGVREAAVGRLLADPRADGLVVDFGVQWLDLAASPHPEAVEARLHDVLRSDRPIHALLEGDSGGLLGDPAWLAAGPASSVQRGHRILDTLLCAAPPPPPPAVSAAADRTDPACAGCHAAMDPLGDALAYLDADGLPTGPPTAAPLLDGTVVDGAGDLAAWVAADPRFVPCVVERWFTYALGRPPEAADAERLAHLEAAFAEADHRFDALVRATAALPAFRTRAPAP